MNIKTILSAVALVAGLAACSTTQQVTLAKQNISHKITSVAQIKQEGDSADMDKNLNSAIIKAGLQPKAQQPEGTIRSSGSDALISYQDVWRWDLAMYLKSVSINIFDAQTGDLLVTGSWQNSAFHGFQDSQKVVEDLVNAMVEKIRSAEK